TRRAPPARAGGGPAPTSSSARAQLAWVRSVAAPTGTCGHPEAKMYTHAADGADAADRSVRIPKFLPAGREELGPAPGEDPQHPLHPPHAYTRPFWMPARAPPSTPTPHRNDGRLVRGGRDRARRLGDRLARRVAGRQRRRRLARLGEPHQR